MATPNLQQVVQGATVGAPDINQLVQAFQASYLVNGPVVEISSQLISTATASVSFNNIPQFNNLILSWSATSDAAVTNTVLGMSINSDNTLSYYFQFLNGIGTGTSATAFTAQNGWDIADIAGNSAGGNGTFGAGLLWLPAWSQWQQSQNFVSISTYFDTSLAATATKVEMRAGAYQPATFAQHTSIQLSPGNGNFNQVGSGNGQSIFTLYGSM